MVVPQLVTLKSDSELAGILTELIAREPIFHHPELGTTRADFEKMTVEDFCEVGASGHYYSRIDVLDSLERRHAHAHTDILEASDFCCRRLAPDVYLLTYNLLQDNTRHTRRATIWQNTADGWKIVYHQGTIVQDV